MLCGGYSQLVYPERCSRRVVPYHHQIATHTSVNRIYHCVEHHLHTNGSFARNDAREGRCVNAQTVDISTSAQLPLECSIFRIAESIARFYLHPDSRCCGLHIYHLNNRQTTRRRLALCTLFFMVTLRNISPRIYLFALQTNQPRCNYEQQHHNITICATRTRL